MHHGTKAWITDFKHEQYQAAARSIKKGKFSFFLKQFLNNLNNYNLVFNTDPDYTREGNFKMKLAFLILN